MKKILFFLCAALLLMGCGSKYKYETVENDQLDTKIYTLDNGLKVYMTVNKEQPRIQTYVAVHAGGKDDPAESTGLAHYLEHLMFKGTKQFGTWNYEAEAVELQKIDALYEQYNKTTDPAERKAIYHQIDSVSYEASRYAIANEYDKLMAAIGASGTNAFTSEDVTCYTEDIPANQLDNWAKIQSDRFQNMVIRLFHTELEAVYEEKNLSLSSDMSKTLEALDNMLYPNHPYGQHTVIGTQEHLKNPSIVNIRRYFENYYRPNNVAICLSGDFNPDEAIDIISKYFGEWKPNEDITRNEVKPEEPITEPIVRDVLGEEAENVWVAWRTPAAKDNDQVVLDLVSSMLSNGQAGLVDLDLVQTHKVMDAGVYNQTRADNGEFILLAYPMPGKTLDDTRALLLDEVKKLRDGKFDDELLQSVITDWKLSRQKMLEENESRAMQYVESFVNGQTWQESVDRVAATEKITREDVIRVAKKYLGEKNYVVVNKRQGEDPNVEKIEKPEINPVLTNRDSVSTFLRAIQESEVKPIEPVFLDYKKDLSFGKTANGMEVICKENTLNETFRLQFIYPFGQDADRYIDMASDYFEYLGTSTMTAEEVQKAFYRLGCSLSISAGSRKTYVTLSGLEENKEEALKLAEQILADLQPDEEALENLKLATIQGREVGLADQDFCARLLRTYALYGKDYVAAHTLSNEEIMALDSHQLVDELKALRGFRHTVTYYGPAKTDDVIALLDAEHKADAELTDAPQNKEWLLLPTASHQVLLAHYNAPSAVFCGVTNTGKTFDPALQPARTLYNQYFGTGGMNNVVFQEIRESRGLAYSAYAVFSSPGYTDDPYYFLTMASTQVDKVPVCCTTFSGIVEQLPESETAFRLAKDALLTNFCTQRTVRDAVISDYLDALDHGIDYDLSAEIYEKLKDMTFADVKAFQQEYVKGRQYTYAIVADKSRLDMDFVRTLGEVQEVSIAEVSGF